VLPVLVLQGLFVRIAPLSSSEAPLAPKLDRARVATCMCAGIARVPARLKRDFTVYRRDARAAAALVRRSFRPSGGRDGDRGSRIDTSVNNIFSVAARRALIPP
jgi:hypothetical protein